jgi:hypothetical protein
MKRGKIRLLLDCLAAHAETEKEGFVFIFFEKFGMFHKHIKVVNTFLFFLKHIGT